MISAKPVDRLEVHILVDNATTPTAVGKRFVF
jgi:hypothetical protein